MNLFHLAWFSASEIAVKEIFLQEDFNFENQSKEIEQKLQFDNSHFWMSGKNSPA